MLTFALSLFLAAPQDAYTPEVHGATDEGRLAMEAFELAEGLQASIFAQEPMLANPVVFDVDHQGVFWVCETFRLHAGVTDMRNHMDWLHDDLASQTVEDRVAMYARHEGEGIDAYGIEHERIRRIADTDGDGVADVATVYADGFNDPADGIAAGVLSYRGDVYYTCMPTLWKLRDDDGDGRSDRRTGLASGFGVHVALLGHDLHGLIVGPDERLYFSSGDRGFNLQTPDGPIVHHHTGAVLRCNLDGSGLEVFYTGLRNPQELAFDDFGNLFTGDNNSDGGDRARWTHIVEGGESGWRYSYQWITAPNMRGPWNDEKLWHPHFPGQAAYLVPPIANLADGPSGLAFYPGTGLHPRYSESFFLCDFRGDPSYSGVHAYRNQPKGASFELGEVERLVWNTLATDFAFGPDGAGYISDWVDGWNMTGKGRIYRIFAPEVVASPLVLETKELLAAGVGQLPDEDLHELLSHPDRRVRQEAHFALAKRDGAVELLQQTARGRVAAGGGGGREGRLARLHAIWALGIAARRDASALDGLTFLLGDNDPEIRAQVARVLGDERHAASAPTLIGRLGDHEPRVQMFAAIALGRLRHKGAVRGLMRVLESAGDDDAVLRHAAVQGLMGCADDAAIARMAKHESEHVRMGALLVMRRRGDPAIAAFLEDPEGRLVVEAARAIHDVPIPAAMPVLAAQLVAPRPVSSDDTNAYLRRVLNARFRQGGADALREVGEFALRDDVSEKLRLEALAMLKSWTAPAPLDAVMGRWDPLAEREAPGRAAVLVALGPGLKDASVDVRKAFLDAVMAAEVTGLSPLAAEWLDAEQPAALRVRAFETLAALRPAGFDAYLDRALSDASGALRAQALEVLGGEDAEAALQRLPAILERGELAERRAAYAILGRLSGPLTGTGAEELLLEQLARLRADLVPAELTLDLVLATEASASAAIRAELADQREPRGVEAELAPFLDGLFGGQRERGQSVFERVDLSCVRCHTTWAGDSVTVGPNLGGVGRRLTRLQLLESIVHPNRTTSPGYQATVLFLFEGGSVAGRVIEETDEFVRIQNSEGLIQDVYHDEIEERRPDLSAMPQGLAEQISRLEMRDLLEYLDNL